MLVAASARYYRLCLIVAAAVDRFHGSSTSEQCKVVFVAAQGNALQRMIG